MHMNAPVNHAADTLVIAGKTYRSRLLVKMKLKNSAELTHYAIKNELIE